MEQNDKTKEEFLQELTLLKQENAFLKSMCGKEISARMLIDESIQGSNPMLEIAMDAAEMAWWEMDIPTGVVSFNKRKSDMLGYFPQDFNHYKDFMKLVHPEDYDKTMNAMLAHFKGETARYETEYRILTKSGEYLWFYDIGSITLRDSFEKPLKVAGLVMNITKRKHAEEALNKLFEEVNHSKEIIEENLYEKNILVEELTKAKEKLEKTNSEKDKFFSIIAHDLRSPFSGLIGLTEIIADDADNFTKDELAKMSNEINSSAKNLFKLLQNLLEWTQIQKGELGYSPAKLNVKGIVNQNINLIKNRIKQKSISVDLNIDETIYANVDENMLNSILRNLLSNAIKFTKKSGIISINAKKKDERMIEIAVSDTGIGMPEELKIKLFSLDKKVGRKGTEGEESTGLGLLLCKEFVEKHSGKIWVESEEGKGSTFYFTLPTC